MTIPGYMTTLGQVRLDTVPLGARRKTDAN
jgi:hypothetical protein